MDGLDLMDLGLIQLKDAAELLQTLKTGKDKTELGRHNAKVTLSFDANNGIVYLVDDCGRFARMEDGYLVKCKPIR
jgi:hypothetical protein